MYLSADSGALRFRLYLPAGYDDHVQLHYPVLYLLHGSDGDTNGTEWGDFFPVLDRLIAQGDIPACIAVVAADGSSCRVDAGHSGDYETAFISDLIPYMDTKYRTLPDRAKRLIVGFSTGGYGALRCCLAFPQLFEGCVLLNPFVQDGPKAHKNYPALLAGYAVQEDRVRFYIFAADDDRNHLAEKAEMPKDACFHSNEQQAVNLYIDLHRKNLFKFPFEKYKEVPGNAAQLRIKSGCHSRNTWPEGFEDGLKYLFGQPESAAFSPQVTVYHATQSGSLSEVMTLQTSLGTALDYRVRTPAGFKECGDTQYPVVYLLHGSHGTASSWDAFYPALDWMMEQKMIKPLITVAPITGNSYWVDSETFGAVESAVINELIPEIDRKYPTKAQRSGRALAGFSMGGFGAVCYAMRHPELFAGAILLSPFVQDAHAPASSRAVTGGAFAGVDGQYDEDLWRRSNYPGLLAEYTAKALPVSMYIYVGDDDWNHLSAKEDLPEDAWRYNIEYQAVKLYLALKSQNPLGAASPKGESAPRDTAQLRVVNGGHNETVWIQGFIEGLQYIERQGFGGY